MADTLAHKFISAKAQGPDATIVSKNEWNDEHLFAGGAASNKLIWDASASDKVAWVEDVINVAAPPYGADITGASDASAIIQGAINDAQVTTSSRQKVVYCPEGTYLMDSEVTFKAPTGADFGFPITLRGARANRTSEGTTFKVKTGFTDSQVFIFTPNGSEQNVGYSFEDFRINGVSIGSVIGITMEVTNTSFTFNRVIFDNMGGNALNGQNCVSCTFDQCRFISGTEDGLNLSGNFNNDIRVINSEFSSNGGWGLHVQNGTSFTVIGNTIQSCAKGGIYAARLRAFQIDSNRFEQNGLTGHTYLTPTIAVRKASIHLNGDDNGTDTTLDPDIPCESGSIRYNIFTTTGFTEHIFVNAVSGVDIENNLIPKGEQLVRGWGDTTYTFLKDIDIKKNSNQSVGNDVEVTGGTQDIKLLEPFNPGNFNNPELLHTIDTEIQPVNLLGRNTMNSWAQLVAGTGGTFTRGASLFFDRLPHFRITITGGISHVFGVDFDLTTELATSLRDKWIYFGMWRSLDTVTNNNMRFYIEFTGSSGPNYSLPTTATTGDTLGLVFRSMAALIPIAATRIQVGIQVIGTSSGVVDVGGPILALVGAPYHRVAQPYGDTEFFGTAVPTAGNYVQGDVVRNTTPTIDGNNMVLKGWTRLVTGAAHVLGTDWSRDYVSDVTPAT